MASSIKNLKPQANSRYKQGYYVLKNPDKYLGDKSRIIVRSSWEGKLCNWADNHVAVIQWSSEPVKIPYFSPIDKKTHQYNVDFWMKILKAGNEEQWLIEVKPSSQMKKPSQALLEGNRTMKKLTRYNRELRTYIVNSAKFEAAKKFAEDRGMRFGVVNEKFLF